MSTTTIGRPTRHHGPHPGILAIIYTGLLIATIITYTTHTTGYNVLFLFGSAIPLGLLTAALTSRLKFLGVEVTGVSIALYGGITASILLIFSALCTWVSSQPGISQGDIPTLQLLSFGSGGIAFVAALGLFMAGISVPCLFGGYAPRWLAWLGLIVAAIGEIAVLGFLIPGLYYLLPVVRFGSVIWMIGIGFSLKNS